MFRFVTIVLIVILLTACSQSGNSRPMVVAANLWIGYSPLYYAEERGWLRQNNIKLVRTTSLAESMNIFKNGSVDVFAGTQYELQEALKLKSTLKTFILLDRSNGGDLILSNKSVEYLKKSEEIDAYLELKSVNTLLLQEFTQLHKINSGKIKYINKTPDSSSKLFLKKRPTVIVTYNPYDILLKKRGYKVIASTTDKKYFIMDALFSTIDTKESFSKEFEALNSAISKSLYILQNNPKEYYGRINKYFEYQNYEEFKTSIKSIMWIYNEHSNELLRQLKQNYIDTSYMLKAKDKEQVK